MNVAMRLASALCLALALLAPVAAMAADGEASRTRNAPDQLAPAQSAPRQLAQSLVETPAPGDLVVRLTTGADPLAESSAINLRVNGTYLREDGPRTISIMHTFPRRIALAPGSARTFVFRPDYPLQAVGEICLNFANGGPAGTANDDWDLAAIEVAFVGRAGPVPILTLAGEPLTRFAGPTGVRCWPVDAPLPPA